MRIAIAGATGLVGARLSALATTEGHDVVELSRAAAGRLIERDGLALSVRPAPVGEELSGGAMRAGPDATLAGPTFETWLAARETSPNR